MPIFKLRQKEHQLKALEYVTKAIAENKTLKIEDLVPKTIDQNSFLHLCLSVYALESGYTLDWVKEEIFKKICNPDIFLVEKVNEKNGEIYIYTRSWADAKKHEASLSIQRFINYCTIECGLEMPDPDNKEQITQLWEDIEKNKEFL